MKDITIKYTDFWPTFDIEDNPFTNALKSRHTVRIIPQESNEHPDILIYSSFGHTHYKYHDSVKIYYTGENDVPDFNACDYAISFHNIDFNGRHLRYPLYLMYEISQALTKCTLSDSEALNRGFCTMLMRNSTKCAAQRLEIIDAVDAYKPVTFGGPYRNNIGGEIPADGKIPFIADYKFNLALENSSLPGYVTEKILEPFAANTVPVYWGAPDVCKDFNPEAFINVNDYNSISSFIDDLKEIDNNPERYLSMLHEPCIKGNLFDAFENNLRDFLCTIADSQKIQRPLHAFGELIYKRNHIAAHTLSKPKITGILARLWHLPKP